MRNWRNWEVGNDELFIDVFGNQINLSTYECASLWNLSKSGIFLELCNERIDKGAQGEIMEVIKAVGVRWLCFPEGVPPTLKSLRLGKLPSSKDLMFIQSLSITFLMDFINHINWGNLEPLCSFELPPCK